MRLVSFFKTKDIHLVKMIDDPRAIFTDGYLYFTVLVCDDFGMRGEWFNTPNDLVINAITKMPFVLFQSN